MYIHCHIVIANVLLYFPPWTLQTRQSPLIMTLSGFRGVANLSNKIVKLVK